MLFFTGSICLAQEELEETNKPSEPIDFITTDYNKGIKLYMARPFSIANNQYKRHYKGLYAVSLSMDFNIKKTPLRLGFYSAALSADNTRSIGVVQVNILEDIVKFHNYHAGVRIGLEKIYKQKTIFSFFIKQGYGMSLLRRKNTVTQDLIAEKKLNTYNAGVEVSYGFFIEDNSSVNLFCGYELYHYSYTPSDIGLSGNTLNAPTQNILTGIAFNFGF